MEWTVPALMYGMTVPFFLAIINLYFYLRFKERFLGFWAISWIILMVRGSLMVWAISSGNDGIIAILDNSGAIGSGLSLILGVYSFLGKKAPRLLTSGTILAFVWLVIAGILDYGLLTLSFPIFSFLSIVHIWAGLDVLKSDAIRHIGKHIAGWALILWGLHKLDYPFLNTSVRFAPFCYFIGGLLFLILSASLLLLYIESIKDSLQKSEERYRSLVCNIPDIVWTADSAGSIVYSSAGVDMTSTTSSAKHAFPESANKFSMVHPDDLGNLRRCWDDFFKNGHPFDAEYRIKDSSDHWIWVHDKALSTYSVNGRKYADGISSEITFRKKAEEEREGLIIQLNEKISQIKTLSGLLPICASCKKIRDDQGYWKQIESYIQEHSDATFSHGVCPECAAKLYPDYYHPKN
ncbi:membrane hypothetical protein [Desulfosarcina cetonica]|uniref:PAS domain-containing protein n=1 Tax=Desulfosarcina cetonica TaxID=90730 RepID=UPI0006D14C76|nr:PAS domain-containing protein [Desulfosarcina cetonica]VTR66939.1 membrane hypothetical protein [Desulfosarcina cetonica]